MKPFEHHLFLYEKKNGSVTKKNGARVIKGAEPSEFGHKVTSTQRILGIDVHNVHTLLQVAGLQQPSAGRTKPYPMQQHCDKRLF